jgi:hypothetical protein
MVIGHFAVAFAAKRVAPRTSLGTLFVAAQLVDLLWPIFLLLGLEQVRITRNPDPFLTLDFTSYPWSHSLAMGIVWGVAIGALYVAITRYSPGALVVALLVPSHWLLDLVVHRPDLPLYPGGTARLGFSLWNYPAATMIVEGAMFIVGVMIYAGTTRARDGAGRYGLWALTAFLIVIYLVSTISPPPPSVSALAWTALIGWPLTLFPWWVDRHRMPRSVSSSERSPE